MKKIDLNLKSLLNISGGLLGFLSVVFVFIRLNKYFGQINLETIRNFNWFSLIFFTVIYAFSGILLALGWYNLLKFLNIKTTRRWSIKIYGLSQLAKYVPGNIFHLAGRQALGMSAGMAGKPLIKSTIWELGLLAFSGAIFGVFALPILFQSLSVSISILLFLILATIIFVLLKQFFNIFIAKAFLYQTIFLFISGVLFTATLFIVNSSLVTLNTFPTIIGVYVVAWLAGLVTPGAPAGLGIRELVLLFFLKGIIPELDLLLAVLLGRMITVAGDGLYFAASNFIGINKKYELVN